MAGGKKSEPKKSNASAEHAARPEAGRGLLGHVSAQMSPGLIEYFGALGVSEDALKEYGRSLREGETPIIRRSR